MHVWAVLTESMHTLKYVIAIDSSQDPHRHWHHLWGDGWDMSPLLFATTFKTSHGTDVPIRNALNSLAIYVLFVLCSSPYVC